MPTCTIVIPTRPGEGEVAALAASRVLDYPREKLELIIARGRQPAVQRNAAIKSARGELVYFLDDDSRPWAGNLRRALAHFQDPQVQMVGGPNLCPPEAPKLERVFAVVLSSWLAFGPSRARYAPVGAARPASEKELILCNLIARRGILLELGGFDESLYPNEENALMDEIQKRGGHLIYDPEFVVYRRPRPTLSAFVRMLLNYGRGRAEQFRLHPTPGSALNFAPPLFCLYLAALPLILPFLGRLGLAPLLGYVAAVLGQTFYSGVRQGFANSLPALPLVVATHLFYGLGFWRGLFTRPKDSARQPVEVKLENIQP